MTARRLISGVAALAAALAAAGCGTGNEPIGLLGDPSSTPSLELPLANSLSWAVTAFDVRPTTNPQIDGFQFTNFAISSAQSVFAPGNGTVTSVTQGTNALNQTVFSITIMHNIHVSSRVSQIASANVRIGDFVTQNQVIGLTLGTIGTSSVIAQLSVLVDGNAVCPYSYLAADARNVINSRSFLVFPGGGAISNFTICQQ